MTTTKNNAFDKAQLFAYIDSHSQEYIDRLAEAVAIPSISSDLATHLPDIQKMMEWTQSHITRLHGKSTLQPNPASTEDRPLPPILLADFQANDHPGKKKTICVYGHLDVQPAAKEDGWDTDPFTLVQKDGKLYGRGSTDDKGPALGWLWTIEAYQALGVDLPVNVKLIYEGMEEYGSDGMDETIQALAKPNQFLYDVDFFCISDNYWLGKTKPCLTYGLRGLAYFEVSVQCSTQDLHSGVLGGTVHEAMTDLIALLNTLVDSATGEIMIPNVLDDVKPITQEEIELYKEIEFDMEMYKESSKVKGVSDKLLHKEKIDLLMARWRNPSLSIHGIEGAFADSGAKTVIPAKVIGKFSMRLVPDQNPTRIEKLVAEHLKKEFEKLQSPNKIDVTMVHGAKAWLSDTKHPNYEAAAKAIETVYGSPPDYTREGGSIPITSALEDATQMSVLLLPVGADDDMAHSQNEKFNISNLINASKVFGMYMEEVANIQGPKPSLCRCEPLTQEELMIPGAFMRGFKCKCEM